MRVWMLILTTLLVLFALWIRIDYSIVFNEATCPTEVRRCVDGTYVARVEPYCTFAACPNEATSTDMAVNVGETVRSDEIGITLDTIMQDTRCVNESCKVPGIVVAQVTLASPAHTETRTIASNDVPVQFRDRMIAVESIAPPRRAHESLDPTSYRVTFRLTRLPK